MRKLFVLSIMMIFLAMGQFVYGFPSAGEVRDDVLQQALRDHKFCSRDWGDLSKSAIVGAITDETKTLEYIKQEQGKEDIGRKPSEIAKLGGGDCDDLMMYFLGLILYTEWRDEAGLIIFKFRNRKKGHVAPILYSHSKRKDYVLEFTTPPFRMYTIDEFIEKHSDIISFEVAYMFPVFMRDNLKGEGR